MGPKKRPRSPSSYNPKERNKVAAYYKKKKAAEDKNGESSRGSANRDPEPTEEDIDLGSDFSEEEGDVEGEDMDEPLLQRGGGGGGMGGGGAGGNLAGNQELGGEKFGQICKTKTAKYKKSFTVFINNGVASMSWAEVAGTTTSSPYVNWNEGWQLIPYGSVMASMTPGQWIELTAKAKKIRLKSCGFKLEEAIPFQEQATQAGDVLTVATASNRPNMWYYKDNTEMLPKLAGNVLSHNLGWQLPYAPYTLSTLPAPIFRLNNFAPSLATHKVVALPPADRPQGIFSLLNTGRVKKIMAGQKISETWKNPNSQWNMLRLNSDISNLNFGTLADPTTYQRNKASILTRNAQSHIGSKTEGDGIVDETPDLTTRINHYADTALGITEGGPPYCLIKVEPYYDTSDNALNIFMKATLHYYLTLEYEENENYNTIAPYNFSAQQASTDLTTFSTRAGDWIAQFGAGNELHTQLGPSIDNAVWS